MKSVAFRVEKMQKEALLGWHCCCFPTWVYKPSTEKAPDTSMVALLGLFQALQVRLRAVSRLQRAPKSKP